MNVSDAWHVFVYSALDIYLFIRRHTSNFEQKVYLESKSSIVKRQLRIDDIFPFARKKAMK